MRLFVLRARRCSAHHSDAVKVVTPSEVAAGKADKARLQNLRRKPNSGLVEGADPRERQRGR